ncbi:F0F1 ATP synthase subunit A [Nesterenkonia rhizosphaerae]|uniref:ATP synthase subunit a n=1 Tax=Nesterenkonia rhizosphaerae TaxID=1348272 RepID=A0ABP9G564_9MICC
MLSLALRAADGGEFQPPTINDTHLPDIIPWGADWGTFFGKNMLAVLLSVIVVWAFFHFAIRRQSLVPTRTQFVAESIYGFVRNSFGRDIIGEKEFKAWVPFLFAVFTFVLVNNLFGAIPVLQMPTFSHAGPAYVIAGIVYVVWVGVGFQRYGLKFIKLATIPSGIPKWITPAIFVLEFISNFIVRPVTHSVRIMAVLLAGHIIVMLISGGAEHLVTQAENIGLNILGFGILLGGIPMYFLELLIMVVQAYVFTLLTAIYLQGALEADAH